LANQVIVDWTMLPSGVSVADSESEYLDFWWLYGSPIYVHVDDETFEKVLFGSRKALGSLAVFTLLTKSISEAAAANPEVFQREIV
jgi:hypothetical protein